MRVQVICIFFTLFLSTYVYSFEVSGYYGFAATDGGEMTLDRGVVESSADTSTFFGLRFGPEYFNGSVGLDLFYHSTTQTFSDASSSLTSTKDFLGTYINAYISYGFFPKGAGEYWLKAYVGLPFFGSMKPIKSDEDHFFSPTGYSLAAEFNIYGGFYLGTRYSSTEYEKYYTNGSAVTNYRSNLIVSSFFTYLSYTF
tara:strand:- start:115 stop:708 length:594 start_codon:yes stop_codon:yes gene_type:complete